MCLNTPSGSAFVRHGTKSCSVTVKIGKTEVLRRKGKGVNEYRCGDRVYKVPGTGVPDEIESLLRIGPINFQNQFDSPFWFSLSPGQVSKELNKIVNLDVIDHTLAAAAARLRKSKSERDVTENRLQKAERAVESLSFVPQLVTIADAVETLLARFDTVQKRKLTLEKALSCIRLQEQKARRFSSSSLPDLSVIEDLNIKVEDINSKRKSLQGCLEGIKREEGRLCQAKKRFQESTAILERDFPGVCGECGRPLASTS